MEPRPSGTDSMGTGRIARNVGSSGASPCEVSSPAGYRIPAAHGVMAVPSARLPPAADISRRMTVPRTMMAMSIDFFDAYARLPASQQRSVRTLITRFNADSTTSGLNYERIQGARDRKLRSLRIDGSYRAIISKPEQGNVHMLLWADKHDEAYTWATRHRCDINPGDRRNSGVRARFRNAGRAARHPQ